MVKELEFTSDVTMREKALKLKESMKQLAEEVTGNKGAEAILVGYEFHFLCGDVLASASGWAEGFKREDYEGDS